MIQIDLFFMDEAELGNRVALWLEREELGWSALDDLSYEMYRQEEEWWNDRLGN